MARSLVTLKNYIYEIRHEVDQVQKTKEFPNELLFTWAHKDICKVVLRLGGLINQLYRANATLAVQSNAGAYDATASHSSGVTTVTGFSGLTPDAWIGGSIMTVVSDVFYSAQITDNDATTITISTGTDLPVMSDDPVFLTANNSQYSISLASLLMINYSEPIWQVLDGSGNAIEPIDVNEARSITGDPMNDNEAYFYVLGQTLQLPAGSSKTLSGNFTVGYYKLPVEATALTDTVDLPLEWHDLAQQMTMARVLKKLGMVDKARATESDLEQRWIQIEQSNLRMKQIDVSTGEQKA